MSIESSPASVSAPPADDRCIFCRIVAGKIPSYKIYEDDNIFAFLDIGPVVRGHTLVIPKAHYVTLMDTPESLIVAINRQVSRIAKAVLVATGTGACHVLVNNGSEAGQVVGHLHYHILPRYEGDGYKINWPSGKLEAGEAGKLGESVRAAMGQD